MRSIMYLLALLCMQINFVFFCMEKDYSNNSPISDAKESTVSGGAVIPPLQGLALYVQVKPLINSRNSWLTCKNHIKVFMKNEAAVLGKKFSKIFADPQVISLSFCKWLNLSDYPKPAENALLLQKIEELIVMYRRNSLPNLLQPQTSISCDKYVNGIKNLYCENNKVCVKDELPSVIFLFKSITNLEIQETNIEAIPDAIKNLNQLTQFVCQNNKKLKNIPTTINALYQLEVLNLDSNNIKTLPDGIFDLKKLVCLNVNSNRIKVISQKISNLEQLTRFECNYNCIFEIPRDIGQLTNLKCLHMKNNLITQCPSEIDKLINLSELHLLGNVIEEMPLSIKNNLKKLQFLSSGDMIIYFSEDGSLTTYIELMSKRFIY